MPFARRLLVPATALAAVLAGCNTGGPAYDLPAGVYAEIIDMTSTLAFAPQTVTIRAGETVLWRNKSVWTHTVTFDPAKAATRTDVVLPAASTRESYGRHAPSASATVCAAKSTPTTSPWRTWMFDAPRNTLRNGAAISAGFSKQLATW